MIVYSSKFQYTPIFCPYAWKRDLCLSNFERFLKHQKKLFSSLTMRNLVSESRYKMISKSHRPYEVQISTNAFTIFQKCCHFNTKTNIFRNLKLRNWQKTSEIFFRWGARTFRFGKILFFSWGYFHRELLRSSFSYYISHNRRAQTSTKSHNMTEAHEFF